MVCCGTDIAIMACLGGDTMYSIVTAYRILLPKTVMVQVDTIK